MSAGAGAGGVALSRIRGLYGMVDVATGAPDPVAAATSLARALLDGGAQVLQLRMKGAGAGTMLAAADALRALCAPCDRPGGRATFIVNDRLDVALAAAADGVHVGQDDLPLAEARALAPAGFLIGVSTHDEAQARAASDGGADYIGFGPLFPTTSKERPDPVVGLARLREVCRRVSIPVVGIGGVTLAHVAAVADAGARAAAIISAVNRSGDVAAAARLVGRAFAKASGPIAS